MFKNPSTRPSQNYYLGPLSESVHEMDGLSQNFCPLSTWTDGRVDGPRTVVRVRGGLRLGTLRIREKLISIKMGCLVTVYI